MLGVGIYVTNDMVKATKFAYIKSEKTGSPAVVLTLIVDLGKVHTVAHELRHMTPVSLCLVVCGVCSSSSMMPPSVKVGINLAARARTGRLRAITVSI